MMAPSPPPMIDPVEKIRTTYGQMLRNLFSQEIQKQMDREKNAQFAKAKRNDLYYRGFQYVVPTLGSSGEVIDYKPAGAQMLLKSSSNKQSPITTRTINHYRGDMRKWIGIIGNKSPNVTVSPEWAGDENSAHLIGLGQNCSGYLRDQWNVDAMQPELALSLAKNGTTFVHTRYETDEEQLGSFEEPQFQETPMKLDPDYFECYNCGQHNTGDKFGIPPTCAQCQTPLGPNDFRESPTVMVAQQNGSKKFANGTVRFSLHSVVDVSTPFYLKDPNLKNCPWLWYCTREDSAAVVDKFGSKVPALMERLKGSASYSQKQSSGGNSESFSLLVQDQASSPSGYQYIQRSNRWTVNRLWLRPSMYSYMIRYMSNSGLNPQSVIAELKKQFPRGMKLTFVEDIPEPVEILSEKLSDVWCAIKPEPSEYLYADPIFDDYIQGADLMNDAWGMQFELMETSVPAIVFDPAVVDPNKVRSGFRVNEWIPAKPGSGGKFDSSFYKVPTSDPKPGLYEFNKVVLELNREMIGLLPAVFGGEGPAQTAEEARRRLNQSLMVLATVWNQIRLGMSTAYENGIRELARYSLGRLVYSRGDAESTSVREVENISLLLGGGWKCTADQAIPMNWTQLRDWVQSLFTSENPGFAVAMGADDPDNMAKITEGIGVPGWKIKGVQERDSIRALIGELLQGSPVQQPGPPDPMTGQPGPPITVPSMTLNFDIEWDPQLFTIVIHSWLVGEGQKLRGTPGHENVLAAGMAAVNYVNMKAAAMAPPPEKGGKGGSPAPPSIPAPGMDQSTSAPPPAPDAPLPPLDSDVNPGAVPGLMPPQQMIQ